MAAKKQLNAAWAAPWQLATERCSARPVSQTLAASLPRKELQPAAPARSPDAALLRRRSPAYARRDVATAAECPLAGQPAPHPGRGLAETPPPLGGFDADAAMFWWLVASTAASLLLGGVLVWLYKAHAEITTHAGLLIQVGCRLHLTGERTGGGGGRARVAACACAGPAGLAAAAHAFEGLAGSVVVAAATIGRRQPCIGTHRDIYLWHVHLPRRPRAWACLPPTRMIAPPCPPPLLQAGAYAASGMGLLAAGGLGTADTLVPGAVLLLIGAVLVGAWRYWRQQIQLTARLLRVSANGLVANPGLVPLVLGLTFAALCSIGPLVALAGGCAAAQHAACMAVHRCCLVSRRAPPAVRARPSNAPPPRPSAAGVVLQNGELGPNPARGGSPQCVDAVTGKAVPCCVFNTGGGPGISV